MNDSALKNFCTWARAELINGVEAQMVRYGITEPTLAPAGSETVNGQPLSPLEVEQRDELLGLQAAEGHDALRDRAAYTWFNRIVAIRFMEARGWLPSRMRMLSRADGSHGSEAVENALDVEISTADLERVAELKMAGSDEPLWRYLFVAQSEELADCLPGVFERVGGAMELLLPRGLMMADGVVGKLNAALTDEDWREGVTVLGWMYQYYNADVKDEFFKSKRKAAAADIAPATQLFTPEWIVRYMVENSLGRLWMLNNPGSSLRERMEYYIEPDAEHEDFIRISSPEEITLCDPACGSGHILVYAFELLFHMYEERGYREREIPELILTKNLAGMEIDTRAAQIAELALAMCSREHDRRFFKRAVRADVTVLSSIPLGEDELPGNKKLAEELSHLGEIGSLFIPSEDEIDELKAAAASCSDDLFAAATKTKLESAATICEKLTRRFTCTVANPPYMGSSSFNPFMSKWIKKNYPDVKSDLCTCFIERGFSLAKDRGYAAMVTMQSWMFLGSFEKIRVKVIDNKTIVSMAHLGPRAFDAIGGEVVNVTADVIYNGRAAFEGAYVRLVDINGSEAKRLKLVEAIQNPACGWFYRRDADTFKQIPGTPIAYWASDALLGAFGSLRKLCSVAKTSKGIITGDNDKFIRLWWEIKASSICMNARNSFEAFSSGKEWFPCAKGGGFRKWSGNQESVVRWGDNGKAVKQNSRESGCHCQDYNDDFKFIPSVSWTCVTSGEPSFRYVSGCLSEHAGMSYFPMKADPFVLLALCNSSVICECLSILSPTLNVNAGEVDSLPVASSDDLCAASISKECVSLSRCDFDSFETSWGFNRSPLV